VDEALIRWQLEEAIRRLTDEHRQVILEVHYRGRAGADVAAELGVPASTVRTRVFYALRNLRLILDEMGWSND